MSENKLDRKARALVLLLLFGELLAESVEDVVEFGDLALLERLGDGVLLVALPEDLEVVLELLLVELVGGLHLLQLLQEPLQHTNSANLPDLFQHLLIGQESRTHTWTSFSRRIFVALYSSASCTRSWCSWVS